MILSQGRRFLNRRTIAVAKSGTQFPRCMVSSSPFYCDNQFQPTRYCSSSSDKKSTSTSTSTSTPTSSHTSEAKDNENSPKDEGEKLKDTVRRMQQEGSGINSDGDTIDPRFYDSIRQASDLWSNVTEEVGKTWGELLRSGERKDINKKIRHPEDTVAGEQEYTGPVDIMVIDESENLTAWERMQKRLTEAPVIQDILSRSEQVYEQSGAKKAKQKVDHLSEDAREAWETSQNPWVYRVSSVYETITAETPESVAVAELRKLDPEFTLDGWRQDAIGYTIPKIMEWLLLGKINQLKPWLNEPTFQRIAAEITARKQEGVTIDSHVLGIMNSEILAVELDEVNKGSPIIVLHFMCQQINCVRKKKDGKIVEGSEDDIRANSYVAAFQREYDEKAGELNWKIVDFRFNGAIAYL